MSKLRDRPTPSERNVIVTVAAPANDRATRRGRRSARIEIAAHLIGEAAASTASVEHGEVRLEALQHNFGGVFFGAALIGPFARLQLASTQLDRSTLAAQRRPKAAPVAALAAVRAIAEGGLPLRKHQSSPYPARKQSSRILFERVSRPESFADISREILFIHRLAQVTQGPIVQGASPVKIARKRSHENRWNPLARIDKTPVEFEPRHGRHMDIGDEAGCFGEARGGEKFGCGRENVDLMAQRSHEPGHGLTTEPIIIDDRNQYLFHHAAYSHSRGPSCGQPTMLCMELPDMGENATSAVPVPHKLWLILTTTAKLGQRGL